MENVAHVVIEKITLECQHLDEAAPLYTNNANNGMPLPNDCRAIQKYLKERFPGCGITEVVNNCFCAEYNMIIDLKKATQPAKGDGGAWFTG